MAKKKKPKIHSRPVLKRYADTYEARSSLDPMSDVLVLLSSLTSEAYFTDIVSRRHALSKTDVKERFRRVRPHLCAAIGYVQQAQAGPAHLAFLPTYYAILDLMKVVILLGPRAGDLPKHRWHGASYDVSKKDSHTVLTEIVTVHRGGALSLFYETLTGSRIPKKEIDVKMADVYPYIRDIGAEYNLTTGKRGKYGLIQVSLIEYTKHVTPQVLVVPPLGFRSPTLSQVRALRRFRKLPGEKGTFRGSPIALGADIEQELRKQFLPFLFYNPWRHPVLGDCTIIPYATGKLLMPEELPIVLLFFHMSSVVRYKPEFLERLQQSRHWPILAAARQHCLLRFLTLAWSFVHQQNLELKHGTV